MFRRLLIANRGEVAARVLRTCRSLGIETVAVASAADLGSSWLEGATMVVALGGARPADSYLDAGALVEVGRRHRCAAVHPGWGFLSENPDFAAMVESSGMTFVGPTPRAMRSMGDKSVARATFAELGLPVIPGTREPLADAAAAHAEAERVGYPVLLKAVAGGGGRGMRVVERPEDLDAAFDAASAEALSSFRDGRMYLERRLTGCAHVEVQVLGDGRGGAIHLGERECSLQRRHQKVWEESPSAGLSEAERAEVLPRVAEAVGRLRYRNAGTVEMLRDATGRLWFMEMNTRLQVEHPVTECVTGVDLVEWQLRVAAGEALPAEPARSGHAIEVRINAEDPADRFRPCPGRVARVTWPRGDGIRVDTHVSDGDRIPPNYDNLVAKLIVHGKDRPAALARLRDALAATKIEGIVTNLPLHRWLVDTTEVGSGKIDTGTLEALLAGGTPWPS